MGLISNNKSLTYCSHLGVLIGSFMSVVDSLETLSECAAHFDGVSELAWDCEGVELGRFGSVTVIQFASRDRCYILDLLCPHREAILDFAKTLLEDPKVTKIIHDPAADSDALYHLHGITVVNVHDTQAWHMIANCLRKRPNLNATLGAYGCDLGHSRDDDIYSVNYKIWETRPFTQLMLDRASSDVKHLFTVWDEQVKNKSLESLSRMQSDYRLCHMRDAYVRRFQLRANAIAQFIGRQGVNIQARERSSGCSFTRKREGDVWVIYGRTQELVDRAFEAVQAYM